MEKTEHYVQVVEGSSIEFSSWCVKCYEEKKNGAVVIYKGESLCQECFEKILKQKMC